MKLLVVLCALGVANAAHLASVVAPLTTSYHAQNELGEYAYGYAGGPSAKEEVRTADGVTRGGYSYVDAHGLVQSAAYVSDAHNGFRVAATNLPIGPAVPAGPVVTSVHAVHSPLLTTGLHLLKKRSVLSAVPLVSAWHAPLAAHYGGYDTPEVTSAKIAHAQYQVAQRAAVATEAAANHGVWAHGHLIGKRSIAALPLVSAWHSPLAAHYGGYDTPEVTSAKIAHAQYQVAQRAAVATEAAANHGLWGAHVIGKRSLAAVPLVSAWHAPLAAHYGGYDTPEVTSAKIAHAQYQVAQRAAVATEAAANHGVVVGHGLLGHGLVGHGFVGHILKKRSLAAVPLVAGAHWLAPSAAAYGGYDTPEVTSAKIAHAQYQVAQRAAVATEAVANHGLWGAHVIGKRSLAAVPLVSAWHAPLAAHYGGYDTPEVTSAKIAHAQYQVAQRAAVATEAAANHGLWGAHVIGKRSLAAVPLVSAWHAPLAAHYGGYDTPEVTSAKIAHAQYQVAQRAAVATEAAANHGVVVGHGLLGHGLVGHGLVGHILKKRSLAAVPLVAGAHWLAPSAAAYGGYDTPEVTAAKVAHANAQVAQRATLAATAVNHGVLAHGHWLGKRSLAAVPFLAGHGIVGTTWVGPSAAAYGGYDTPEVTSAKIAHANAQVVQRATLAATAAADPDNHVVLAHHGLLGLSHLG